jgi:EmrB/QacA subfamily drug resistance transporter
MHSTSERATRAWVLGLTAAASFMIALDALVVATALSTIRTSLSASIQDLQWTISAYNLSFAMLLLTGAALGDRFGRRRIFAVGVTLFTLASVACALAPTIGWLIAARAAQGASAAMVTPLGLALLGAAFPKEERAKALGIFSSLTGLALIGGPVVGGVLVQNIDWHWIFWVNVPVGAIIVPVALARLPESRGPSAALDLPGLGLGTAAALGLVWALVRGNDVNEGGWTSPETLVALLGGVLLGAAFVARERSAAQPLVPLRMFRSRAFSSGNAACFLFTASLYGTLFFLAQFFQVAQSYSPVEAGLRLLPWTATLFVVAPVAGRLVATVGERTLVVAGLTLQALGMAWIALIATPTVSFAELIAPLVVAGAGVSMAMPAAQNAVLGAVAPVELGKASGTYNMLRFLGGVFGIAISAAAFTLNGGYSSSEAFAAGFVSAIGASAALALLGAVVGWWQPARIQPALLQTRAAA